MSALVDTELRAPRSEGRGSCRIWRTNVDPLRVEEYARFAQDVSLPIFRVQQGFLGVLFAGAGPASSPSYLDWSVRRGTCARENRWSASLMSFPFKEEVMGSNPIRATDVMSHAIGD